MNSEKVNGLLPIALNAVVMDCKDITTLSDFYLRLLGWNREDGDEDYVVIVSPDGKFRILFQRNADYVPPVWPEKPGQQQQMVHLDFTVQNTEQMELAVNHAISCGAMKASAQYSEKWTVMIDPAGHPFCFVIW